MTVLIVLAIVISNNVRYQTTRQLILISRVDESIQHHGLILMNLQFLTIFSDLLLLLHYFKKKIFHIFINLMLFLFCFVFLIKLTCQEYHQNVEQLRLSLIRPDVNFLSADDSGR